MIVTEGKLQRFERREFRRLFDGSSERGTSAVFADMEFVRCVFDNCLLSATPDPATRSTVSNVRLIDCSVGPGGVGIDSPIFDNVTVEGLRVGAEGILSTHGAVFKHVTLRGRLEPVRINRSLGMTFDRYQAAFDQANRDFYRGVDWALDIREADPLELDFEEGVVPGDLVRREPVTQVLIRRENAHSGRWRRLDLPRIYSMGIQAMLDRNAADLILVTGSRRKNFDTEVAALERLRGAGVADRD